MTPTEALARIGMKERELRWRLGMYGNLPFAWYALREAYAASEHKALPSKPYEEPFTVEMAIGWAERLADAEL